MSKMNESSGFFSGVNKGMTIASALLVTLFVLFTMYDPKYADSVYTAAKDFIARDLAWYYVGLVNFFLFSAIYIMFSRYGSIRLGNDDDKPEYSFFSWFSMLFGAGLGIGILFWSIAEPIYHLQSNPFISEGQALSVEAAKVAMRISIFHWGLHAWGLFAISGLSLAYFCYRKGLPLSVRSGLYPIFGDRIYGPIGHLADLLAVFGTVFGLATSLGLGAQQINAGFNYLFGLEVSTNNQVVLIMVISILATISVLSGVNKGIKLLSEFNMRLTVVILTFFLVLGPTVYILGAFVGSIGDYFQNVISLGFWVDSDPEGKWQGGWTIFYWGWWIAWAPFVGMFIARISRGRTIREFVFGVLIAPIALSMFWLSTFGNTAIFIELFGGGGIVDAVNQDITTALFKTIELMGLNSALTIAGASICIILLVTYFITSADSATLVICTILSMGSEHPPSRYRIFWGLSIGAVAGALLLSGGLKALQTASIVAALPYSVVLILTTWGLFKSLRQELLPDVATSNGTSTISKPNELIK